MIQLRTDLAIFVIFQNGSLAGVIGIHVDDFILCGNKWFYSHFLPKLRRAFLVGKEKYGDFEFCGLHVHQDTKTYEVSLDQISYANSLSEVPVEKNREKDEKCSDKEFASTALKPE